MDETDELMIRFLLSHPKINPYWQNLALAVYQEGLLEEFHTTLAWNLDHPPATWLPSQIIKRLSPRSVDPAVARKLVLHPWREIARLAAPRLGMASFTDQRSGFCSVNAVYRELDRIVAERLPRLKSVSAVICGEDGSHNIFAAARDLGMRRIYELPIGYHPSWRRILAEERNLSPEFAALLPGVTDSEQKLARKREEAALADLILVPSDFVRDTLLEKGISRGKIRVVPYGAPIQLPAKTWKTAHGTPLRLLYAGGIHQRKGISYLLSAVQKLHRADVSLTLIGAMPDFPEVFAPYRDFFTHIPPVPQQTVQEQIRNHDVLVLPSLFEGMALVILEAMAAGIPVIVTPNSGALPIVRDGIDGFVVPIRSSEALMEKICWFADNRESLVVMGRNARLRAEEYSWERYRDGIRNVISELDPKTTSDGRSDSYPKEQLRAVF
jgi:glycosyltransferase involved in cell wall biosynthesis